MAYSSKYWRLDLGMQPGQTDGDQLSEVVFFDGTGAAISLTGATVTASSTGSATNLLPASKLTGAVNGVIGSGGSYPVGLTSYSHNVTVTIVGSGVVNGLNYVDIQFSGTASSSYQVFAFDSITSTIAAAKYTTSCYLALVGGSLAGTTGVSLELRGDGAIIDNTVSLTNNLQRFSTTGTPISVSGDSLAPAFNIQTISGQACNLTLRIAAPQLEQASGPSAYVPQPGGVASGAPSVLTDGNANTWWYPGTLAAGGTGSVYLTFPSAVDVGSIQFTQGNALFEGPANTAIYTSPDGSTWTKVSSANFATWSGTTPQTVILTEAEISQLGASALTVNNPQGRIEQLGAQALTVNNPQGQIEQLGAQALTVNNPAAQIFQAGLLAFVQYYPAYEIFQLGASALTINDPEGQVEQLGAQALTVNDPQAQVRQLGLMAFVRYVSAASPAPLVVTRKPGTRIDAAMTYDPSLRALDALFDGTDFVLDETPSSVLLHSLLVDRRAHPDDTWPQPVPDWANPSSLNARKGWVGDALDQNGLLVGSRLWELDRRLSDEQTRSDCQDYLVEAVQPLEGQRGYAIKIQVAWELPQILGYSVTVGSTTIQLKKAMN